MTSSHTRNCQLNVVVHAWSYLRKAHGYATEIYFPWTDRKKNKQNASFCFTKPAAARTAARIQWLLRETKTKDLFPYSELSTQCCSTVLHCTARRSKAQCASSKAKYSWFWLSDASAPVSPYLEKKKFKLIFYSLYLEQKVTVNNHQISPS